MLQCYEPNYRWDDNYRINQDVLTKGSAMAVNQVRAAAAAAAVAATCNWALFVAALRCAALRRVCACQHGIICVSAPARLPLL